MSPRALLERLIAGPASPDDVMAGIGVDKSGLHALLDGLRAAGIAFAVDTDGRLGLASPVELLDRNRIVAAMSTNARDELAAFAIDFDVPSTQQLALDSPAPAHGSAVWLAERQTAGQGQRGRAWQSPLASGIALSLSRRFGRSLAQLSGLSLAVGTSVADAVRRFGYDGVGVKWPNDLVADSRKLGGILIQLRGPATGPCEAVIGIGLNHRLPAAAAQDIDQPWCDLATLRTTAPPSRNDVVAAVLDELLPALARFDAEGLPAFLPRWSALDALADRPVRIVDGHATRDGIARGIDATGALRVSHDGAQVTYHSGHVSVRQA